MKAGTIELVVRIGVTPPKNHGHFDFLLNRVRQATMAAVCEKLVDPIIRSDFNIHDIAVSESVFTEHPATGDGGDHVNSESAQVGDDDVVFIVKDYGNVEYFESPTLSYFLDENVALARVIELIQNGNKVSMEVSDIDVSGNG